MKTTKFLILFLSITLLTACSNDDDNYLPNFTTWNLTNISGGFAGIDDTYEEGVITWRFYDDDNILEVVNNNSVESLIDLFETGTYAFSLVEIDSAFHMFIDDIDYGVVIITPHRLTIDQQASDGFLITLTR